MQEEDNMYRLMIAPLKGWTISNVWQKNKNKISIQEGIERRSKSENASYHSIQNFCLQFSISKLKYMEI